MTTPKAVLGYSGGLDTSVMIHWLKANKHVDVVCVLVDGGQPVTIRALAPDIQVIAPLREWTMTRAQEIEYARQNHVLIPDVARKSEFSTDENLWGRSVEAGVLENPENEVVPAAYAWTTAPEQA